MMSAKTPKSTPESASSPKPNSPVKPKPAKSKATPKTAPKYTAKPKPEAATKTTANPTAETHVFQAEAKQLLRLMTHSLYSNREIFIRELVSNAADACDKLRFEALDNGDIYAGDSDLRIRIELDPAAKTITVTDNGIGMSREEVIANIGTIASSGTAQFLEKLTGDQQKDAALIGQFGVGFYSAFIVAKRVELFTRRAGAKPTEGVHWACSGEADYELRPAKLAQRGTRVVLHLKPDAAEFANDWSVRATVKKYSDHIAIPVEMAKPFHGEEKDRPESPEFAPVNSVKALWTRSRTEVSDEEYREFYRHIAHDPEPPLAWSHNRVEGKLDYTSLLYLPAAAPFDLWQREAPRGLKFYVRRTFILDHAEQFLPLYLRFVKGIVDCNDLPLNISRELLQQSKEVDSIKTALTKRVLDMLGKMAKNKPADYQKFWDAFGQVLKEGPVEDPTNLEKLTALLRFASTHDDAPEQRHSLDQYLERMQEEQEKIYYLVADSFGVAVKSPLLEAFRARGCEVLLLTDRIDEWLMSHLPDYQGKVFQDVARGELPDLQKASAEGAEKSSDKAEKDPLIERIADYLGERVAAVRASSRLVESPACLVISEQDMGMQMRRIMQAAGQEVPEAKPILELNLKHPLLARLGEIKDATKGGTEAAGAGKDKDANDANTESADASRFADLIEILFDQASLAVGEQLADPTGYVRRINKLLFDL